MKLELYGRTVNARRLILLVVLPLVCVAALAIVFLPLSFVELALTLLLVLPGAFLLIDRPALVFYILIIILFSNLDIYASFPLYRYVVVVTIVSFALAIANGRRIVSHHSLVIALVAAFAIIAFQSLSVAREYGVGMRKLVALLKVLVVLWIVMQFAGNRRELRRFLLVLAAGILMADFLPFVLHPPARFASFSLLWSRGVVRYEGFVFEPNTFAMFQIFLIPILVFFTGAVQKPRIARLVFLALIVASVCVLILSFSRGGFVGLMCLVVTLLVVERRSKPLLISGVALIAAGIVVMPAVYWDRVKSLLDFASGGTSDFAIMTRVETMRAAFKLSVSNPLLGVGIDNFMSRAARFNPYPLTVHNTPLQILSELGIFALALFVGIVVCNIAIIRRMMARRDDPETARLGRALLMQQIAMLATTMFLPGAYEMIFWFMLALPAIAEYAYGRGEETESRGALVPSGRK
jgi:O-antigen ligase